MRGKNYFGFSMLALNMTSYATLYAWAVTITIVDENFDTMPDQFLNLFAAINNPVNVVTAAHVWTYPNNATQTIEI